MVAQWDIFVIVDVENICNRLIYRRKYDIALKKLRGNTNKMRTVLVINVLSRAEMQN